MIEGYGQRSIYKGNWYVGAEVGVSSSRTRMSAGELGTYTAGWSGVMPMYGFKAGHHFNPALSVESGLYSLPINIVYSYQSNRIVGGNPLNFVMLPLRANWRVRVLHRKLEARISSGIQYVNTATESLEKTNVGEIVLPYHTTLDTLKYNVNVVVGRRHAFNAEVALSFNWILSNRLTLNIYGRQLIGLMNIAQMKVAIKSNKEPVEYAEFLTKSSGFTTGFGLQYNFHTKQRFPK